MARRVGGVYGKPWADMAELPLTRDLLEELGKCLVESVRVEAKKDFAKRGWSEWDRDHKVKISDSFDYEIVGKRTVVITCSYEAIERLLEGRRPYPMKWLVQPGGGKEKSEEEKKAERKLRAKRKTTGSMGTKRGKDARLIVPLQDSSGKVIFRMAPLKTADAWIHPGIAKFTFLQRGLRKGKEKCKDILRAEAVKQLKAAL